MSVVAYEKPLTKISLADWYSSVWQLQQTNETRRQDAFNLRHELRQMRNETRVKTDWDTYHNNVRLADRAIELNRWRDLFKSCLDKVNEEISFLKAEKLETEKDLDALPLDIIGQCISIRDQRHGKELTYDEADTELKRELCLVEHVKSLLKEKCQLTWEKINRLEEVRFTLTLDLDNKTEAYNIDKEQLILDKNCADINFKTDPLRNPNGSVTYEGWLDHTERVKQHADNELSDTLKFRETLFVTRNRAKNDMLAQREYVDFILRKRVYETQKARNELEWQLKKMKEEMEKIKNELRVLKDRWLAVTNALKLAQTRIENRCCRPHFELSREYTDYGLKEEVLDTRQTRKLIQNKIDCATSTYNALEDQVVRVENDVSNKNHALMLDLRILDLRIRMRGGDAATQTDRNIQLTAMEKEIPPT